MPACSRSVHASWAGFGTVGSSSVRIYHQETKKNGALAFPSVCRLHRLHASAPVESASLPAPADGEAAAGEQAPFLFMSESLHQSFFRRPAWSPDGGILVLPSGQLVPSASDAAGASTSSPPQSVVHVVTRAHLAGCVGSAPRCSRVRSVSTHVRALLTLPPPSPARPRTEPTRRRPPEPEHCPPRIQATHGRGAVLSRQLSPPLAALRCSQ